MKRKPMSDDLYDMRVLRLAATLDAPSRLKNPDASADAVSRLCGSRAHVELQMRDGVVSHFAQSVHACLLGQASASVMAKEIVGETPQSLRALAKTMRAMLRENGAPPSGKWRALAALKAARDYPMRHASTLLVFDAVEDCLSKIEAKDA